MSLYGFTAERWGYIWKNRDFIEVFKPDDIGYAKAMFRKKFWDDIGYEAIFYEDLGVSVGVFVMRKDNYNTDGQLHNNTYVQVKWAEYIDRDPAKRGKTKRKCQCGAVIAKRMRLCDSCKENNRRETKKKSRRFGTVNTSKHV